MAQAINRYFNRQAAQPDFYQEPLDMLAVALDAKQKRYDQGLAASDELYNTQLDSLKQDRAAADSIIQGYQSQIDQLVEQSGGDYSTLQPQLYRLKRQITKDYSPGGKAHAIATMKAQTDARIAEERKRVGKEITADQLGTLMSWFDKTYTGVGEKDPVTGNYNMVDLPTLAKYTDVNALVTEYAKDIVPQKIDNGSWVLRDGKIWEKTTTGTVEITPDRIRKIVENGLASNQEFMGYAQQMSELGNPLSAQDLERAIQRGIGTYAQFDFKQDQDIKYDQAYLIGLRQRLHDQSVDRYLNAPVPVDTMPGMIINEMLSNQTTDKLGKETANLPEAIKYPIGTGYGLYQRKTDGPFKGKSGFGENFNAFMGELNKNAPALKSMAQDVYQEVARDASLEGKTPQEKWNAFSERWNKGVTALQTVSTTSVKLPKTYATGVLWPMWDEEAKRGQWYKVNADGSTTLVAGKQRENLFEDTPKPISVESMGERTGFGASDAAGNKYIVTGTSDRLTATLDPIMKLHSPLITGKEGHSTLSDGKNVFNVKTSIGRYQGQTYLRMDKQNPETGKWEQLKESDGTPVRGELELARMQGNLSTELFRNSDLDNQFMRFGNASRAFDAGVDPIELPKN